RAGKARSAAPAAGAEVVDLERPERTGVVRAASHVEPLADHGGGLGRTRRRGEGEPAPAVPRWVVAEQDGGGLREPRGVAAVYVQATPVRDGGRVVERQR